MDSMLDILLNHGSLGVFAAFLIWLYTNMQQRMDELVNKFQTQIDEMRKDQKTEQELLRVRYDDVIGKYDSERQQMRVQIKDKLEKVGLRTQKIDQRTSNILVRQESGNDDISSLDKNKLGWLALDVADNEPPKKITNIHDIWNGEELNKIRKIHMEKQLDKIDICKNCDFKDTYEWKKIN